MEQNQDTTCPYQTPQVCCRRTMLCRLRAESASSHSGEACVRWCVLEPYKVVILLTYSRCASFSCAGLGRIHLSLRLDLSLPSPSCEPCIRGCISFVRYPLSACYASLLHNGTAHIKLSEVELSIAVEPKNSPSDITPFQTSHTLGSSHCSHTAVRFHCTSENELWIFHFRTSKFDKEAFGQNLLPLRSANHRVKRSQICIQICHGDI